MNWRSGSKEGLQIIGVTKKLNWTRLITVGFMSLYLAQAMPNRNAIQKPFKRIISIPGIANNVPQLVEISNKNIMTKMTIALCKKVRIFLHNNL